jgi:hypothetical protein
MTNLTAFCVKISKTVQFFNVNKRSSDSAVLAKESNEY